MSDIQGYGEDIVKNLHNEIVVLYIGHEGFIVIKLVAEC